MREQFEESFSLYLTKKLDMLWNMAGKFKELPKDCKVIYFESLKKYDSNRKLLDEVFHGFAIQAKAPSVEEILSEVHRIERRSVNLLPDYSKEEVRSIVNPEHVLLAYLACKNFMPSIPRTMTGNSIDIACEQLFGESLSDDALRDKFPPEKVKSYLETLH